MRQAWWQAGEHMSERTLADTVRMHELAFGICAPFSCFQLLVLVVCAAVIARAMFSMMRLRRCGFSSGVRGQKYTCQRRATRHARTCDGGRGRSREMGCGARRGRTAAYRTQWCWLPATRRTRRSAGLRGSVWLAANNNLRAASARRARLLSMGWAQLPPWAR